MANIEIDGQSFEVENGKMIIEVADEAGIYIPRFCYHKKLSIAANCRMCLVEVENGRKPVPACATPITNGMKVFTKSEEALRSQKAVMEFLLINHPLDCPICDQGGECELQDLSMGFGYGESEYHEEKRSVVDDNLGALIATEMTRCIQCTRCLRFGEEVAGVRELGATGRGERMQIGTYVQHSLTSEISANIIDLCPVGALTSKPSRFTARPWELTQYNSVAIHDCLGSNVHLHVRRNELIRVVPRENETINETWLSDRDRFSYLGLNHAGRATSPLIKRNGQWETVDWPTALAFAAEGLGRILTQYGPEHCAAFASPSSTVEELFILQKLMRSLGINNLDHRLHQTDFKDQSTLPTVAQNSLKYAEIEQQKHIFIIGCHITREVPLAGVRVRKAQQAGALIYAINPVDYEIHAPVALKKIISPQEMPMQLAMLLKAVSVEEEVLPAALRCLLVGLEPDETTHVMAAALKEPGSAILVGAMVENHPESALLRSLLHALTSYTQARIIHFTNGANTAGARIAGMLPDRNAGTKFLAEPGLTLTAALEHKLKSYVLLNVEPGLDIANPHFARQAMLGAEFVVMLSAYQDEGMKDYADVILPIATFSETSGTYINVDNIWQTVTGACTPKGESRPAWKVLRVLGNLLHRQGFDYESSEEILAELRAIHNQGLDIKYEPYYPEALPFMNERFVRVGEWPMYRNDALVRHAQTLQECASSESACIKVHPDTADRLKLDEVATVSQGNIEITLPLKRDTRMALDVVWVANALPETGDLGRSFSSIAIKRWVK